jgi:hypothetical protein
MTILNQSQCILEVLYEYKILNKRVVVCLCILKLIYYDILLSKYQKLNQTIYLHEVRISITVIQCFFHFATHGHSWMKLKIRKNFEFKVFIKTVICYIEY